MIKYITVIEEPSITLDLMGRKKIFTKDQEVTEDIYTKSYPQYFKRLGEIKGITSYLATPVFIPDEIAVFVKREKKRKQENKVESIIKPKVVEIDEIAEAAEEFLDLDSIDDFDVKIETEEIGE